MSTNTTQYFPAVLELTRNIEGNFARGSAVLLEGGRFVLTAAHLVAATSHPGQLKLRSLDRNILPEISVSYIHPDWDSANFNHDIALLELATPITDINGLSLYQGPTPLGQSFTQIGFGLDSLTEQHIGTNQWDASGEVLNSHYQREIPANSQLLADYDNGTQAQNMLNRFNISSSALPTTAETIAFSGDSGGPALIDGQIAGISSYVIADPDYDNDPDHPSSPGEVSASSNISYYRSWIEYITQGNTDYQAPSQPAEVNTSILEPDFGSVINHFLLSLSQATNQEINLWYQTLDGSAHAGEDYLASSGWLNIQPGQAQISIPVTILGDQLPETDESFSLQITDPSGHWLSPGISLLASHSIIDNDPFTTNSTLTI